jgi:transcriptional regulator NrdR family protein
MNKTPSEMNLIDLENDFELFFTDPQQLLAIFTELEEQNLSLIQNSQDHEEQLEEISRELQITMEKKNSETESLQRQVNYLEQSITLEQQKEKELMAKVG